MSQANTTAFMLAVATGDAVPQTEAQEAELPCACRVCGKFSNGARYSDGSILRNLCPACKADEDRVAEGRAMAVASALRQLLPLIHKTEAEKDKERGVKWWENQVFAFVEGEGAEAKKTPTHLAQWFQQAAKGLLTGEIPNEYRHPEARDCPRCGVACAVESTDFVINGDESEDGYRAECPLCEHAETCGADGEWRCE